MTDVTKMQPVSRVILEEKYASFKGETLEQIKERLIKGILKASKEFHNEDLEENFFEKDFILDKFIPGGRIVANLGVEFDEDMVKRNTMINCYSSGKIEDSMEGIMDNFSTAAKTLQSGGGIGTNFSSIRPKGAPIKGVLNGFASGPVSFMEIGDSVSKTIRGAGSRRGASIAVLSCRHPDIMEFITCKETPNKFTQYNISVGIENGFMDAVRDDEEWELRFPVELEEPAIISKKVKAREIWEAIMKNTYESAEPGVLFLDNANLYNPFCASEPIVVCNP